MGKNKRKRKNKKNKSILKNKNLFFCLILLVLVTTLSYIIFKTDILKPQVNQLTASYISFNNSYNTDMIKLDNLRKMNDRTGKGIRNLSQTKFNVNKEKNSSYDIVIYSLTNKIDEKYVKYYIEIDNKIVSTSNLKKAKTTEDGGKIIYEDNNKDSKKNNNIILRMWVDKNYKGKVNNVSFEVKVKPR